MYNNIKYGVRNLFIWLPIIWRDRDWDWAFLAILMEFKLRRMSHNFKEFGYNIKRTKRDAKRMLTCAVLLKRIYEDDYKSSKGFDHEGYLQKQDEEYLFKLMRKHMREWWI